MRMNRVLVLIGGLLLIVGSQLPWVSFRVLYGLEGPAYQALEIGWEGGGTITGSMGLILLLIGIFWRGKRGKIYSLAGVILAGLTVLMVVASFYRILEIDPEDGFFKATDAGIYVTLAGGLVALAGAIFRNAVLQKIKVPLNLIIVTAGGLALAGLIGRAGIQTPTIERIAPQAVRPGAQPVVIDTDMAADDWLAILFLLSHPDVDVKAVTVTGAGEASCPTGAQHARSLVALAGRPGIPVACGRQTPLVGDHAFPASWRENVDDLFGLTLPENNRAPSDESAVDLLSRVLRGSPQKVHLITLGPLTNVGEMLAAEPELAMKLEMITVMGGAVEVAGNVGSSSRIENDVAEWNFYVDPRAAAAVLGSGAPVTLVPLDATNDVPVTMTFYKHLEKDRMTSVAEFVYQVLSEQEQFIYSGSNYFWDPLTAAIVIDESLTTFEEIPLIVIEEEGAESGRTLAREDGSIISVAIDADREHFETLFLDALNGRLP